METAARRTTNNRAKEDQTELAKHRAKGLGKKHSECNGPRPK